MRKEFVSGAEFEVGQISLPRWITNRQVQRVLFGLIAPFASLMIENGKVYDYLRQNFAQHSQELIEANRKRRARETRPSS